MFDIGFFELLVIGVVLLLVMGPERLPEVARQAAFVIKRVRAWVFQMKSEMKLIDDPMLAEFKKTKQELNEFQRDLKQAGNDFTAGLDKKIETDVSVESTVTEIKTIPKKAAKKKTTKKTTKKRLAKKVTKKTTAKKVVKKTSKKKPTKRVAKTKKASK